MRYWGKEESAQSVNAFSGRDDSNEFLLVAREKGVVLTIMAYTGRLRPKGVPYLGFKYLMKGHRGSGSCLDIISSPPPLPLGVSFLAIFYNSSGISSRFLIV